MTKRQDMKRKMNLLKRCIGRKTWVCGTWCLYCLKEVSESED